MADAYVGRFAPSPTGLLHAGSLVAALASWLDARAHHGRWLLRIEDTDTPRCPPGAAEAIVDQLQHCGLRPDAEPCWQSTRSDLYATALQKLIADQHAYPCGCSRKDIDLALQNLGMTTQRHAQRVYPGTCRQGLQGRAAKAWRVRVPQDGVLRWYDRRLGAQLQDLGNEVGDFVLRRADGLWAYQLAVVVDDADQGVTHVVRGEDLADNTPRQLHLQRLLGFATPQYLHTPLVFAADGQKLSKQTGASAIDLSDPLHALQNAAKVLGLPADLPQASLADWLAAATLAWPWRLKQWHDAARRQTDVGID